MSGDNRAVDVAVVRSRVETHIRAHDLLEPGGPVLCLVSGGADSTCLWHLLRELGYAVSAVHVDHGLRGRESDADAAFCRDALGAEVVNARGRGRTEAELREARYEASREPLRGLRDGVPPRATGHTASDQVETVLLRLVSSGSARGIKARREDGVVRPLLPLWREETRAYCRVVGMPFRDDSTNSDTKRGLIRAAILPLLRELHPAADRHLLALGEERPRLPRQLETTLLQLLASRDGSARVDLGSGLQAVREYDRLWLERGPVALEGRVRWGPWTIEADVSGLRVRGWRPGDRLAGRRKKVQDVFVDAKVPRSEREAWPLVVRGDEVVAIPGLVESDGVRATREPARLSGEAGE